MKIRIWIVRKLGGMFMSDLPLDMQQDWLNRAVNKTVDKFYADSLMNGFKNHNK